MASSNIFIAKRKGERTHVFLRAYRRKAVTDADFLFSMESLDKLLLAQDPESFTYAVSNFYPLSLEPLCKSEIEKKPRRTFVSRFRADCAKLYDFIDGGVLIEEYTGVKDDGTELNKSSMQRAVKNFDAIREDSFLRFLDEGAFSDDDYVIAEPVQDWTAAKAILSNMVLFQAFLNNEAKGLGFDTFTTHNGYWLFGSRFDKRIKERVKQFTYNSIWNDYESTPEVIGNTLKGGDYVHCAPWLHLYTRLESHGINIGESKTRLKGSEHIYIKGSGEIDGQALSLFTKVRKQVVDRSIYLTADLDCTDEEIARDFANAILTTTRDLKSFENNPLGWDCDLSSAVEEPASPKITFHSQGARLIYETAFHPQDVKAAVCKYCGRPMLNQAGTKPRQFCRPSCKTNYSNARKEALDD